MMNLGDTKRERKSDSETQLQQTRPETCEIIEEVTWTPWPSDIGRVAHDVPFFTGRWGAGRQEMLRFYKYSRRMLLQKRMAMTVDCA